jgi:exosortase
VIWSYWGTGAELVRVWSHDPTYSHGYIVVLFAVYLLWRRKDMLRGDCAPSILGLPLLLAAALARVLGGFYHLVWVDEASLLPALAGICLLCGGKPALKWASLPIAFLLLAVPLPGSIGTALSLPLKRFATVASTYFLQVFGFTAVADANVILLEGHELGIIDACSGLRMLVVFFATAAMLALLVEERPLLIRLILLVSAVPIALIANVTRVTLTGILTETAGDAVAQKVYHDFAGWLMMAIGLVLFWAELLILARLILPAPGPREDEIGLPALKASPARSSRELVTGARGPAL